MNKCLLATCQTFLKESFFTNPAVQSLFSRLQVTSIDWNLGHFGQSKGSRVTIPLLTCCWPPQRLISLCEVEYECDKTLLCYVNRLVKTKKEAMINQYK